MSDLMEYKCPCCGGGINFDSSIQKLKCPYCDTEFEIDTIKSFGEETKEAGTDKLDWNLDAGSEWGDGEKDGLKMYQCQSCGAQIVADDTLASSKCPYCDNPIVMKEQYAGDLKPDFIIPFKLDKKAAKEKYKAHLTGKKFLPKVFLDDNHIDEIKGVYVPFWLFDTDADAYIRYKGTKTRFWSDSRYDYTETNYYSITRAGSIGFNVIPVDGSTKMADDLMESIEPYDFKDAVPFNSAYLAGYLADRYDVDADASIGRAHERVKKSTEEAFSSTVSGFDSVTTDTSSVKLKKGEVKYALYPVWLLNTTWNDQKYIFAMNGQTGKFVGNLPCDKKAASVYQAKVTGIAFAAALAVSIIVSLLLL